MKYAILVSAVTCFIGCDWHHVPHTNVEYTSYKTDGDQDFVAGMLCIATNIEAPYVVTNALDKDFRLEDISPPQDPLMQNNCILLEPGSYIVTFGDRKGYMTPPPAAPLELQKSLKIKVFGYFASQ
jgi:hypothetical protein